MATYYVDSSVADDTGAGTSWATAKKYFASAIALASASGDVIKVSHTHVEALSADTTYTFLNNIAVVAVDKTNGDTPTVMDGTSAYIGHLSTSYNISFAGAYSCYLNGLAFVIAGSTAKNPRFGSTDSQSLIFENCKLWLKNTGPAQMLIGPGSEYNVYCEFRNCDFWFGSATQYMRLCAKTRFYGCTLNPSGVAPTTLFGTGLYSNTDVWFEGCDFSYITGTLCGSQTSAPMIFNFVNCVINESVTVLASQTPINNALAEAFLFNTSSGDMNYNFAHYSPLGSTTVSTTIYTNDNPTYDGANKCSWVVVSTAGASFFNPYKSPWIDKYHDGVSAITPYLEVLRDGSATAYQNDEVWAEFSYQGTTGYPLAKFADDRMIPLGTPAEQAASSKTASDWTGENATAWFGKLDSGAAITPAEIGHLRARVCIGEPSTTLYVDPQIRV